jgi:hypothetical protein
MEIHQRFEQYLDEEVALSAQIRGLFGEIDALQAQHNGADRVLAQLEHHAATTPLTPAPRLPSLRSGARIIEDSLPLLDTHERRQAQIEEQRAVVARIDEQIRRTQRLQDVAAHRRKYVRDMLRSCRDYAAAHNETLPGEAPGLPRVTIARGPSGPEFGNAPLRQHVNQVFG